MLAGTPDPVSSGLAGCGPGAAGAGTIPGVTAARLHSQRELPVGYGSRRAVQWCLAALISALGWPKAQTDDTGGSGRTGVGTRYPPSYMRTEALVLGRWTHAEHVHLVAADACGALEARIHADEWNAVQGACSSRH